MVYIRKRYFFFSSVYLKKRVIKNFEVKVDVQKGALRLEGKMTIDEIVSSNSRFIHCYHVEIVLNEYHVHIC